jgi:hypothetical protein
MAHPSPADAKIVTANQLKVGTLMYVEAGWRSSPEEFHGCWRTITSVDDAHEATLDSHMPSERDLVVQLEIFQGEKVPLFHWFDNHTLVIVHRDT